RLSRRGTRNGSGAQAQAPQPATLRLLFIGRMDKLKGGRLLLRAVPHVRRSIGRIKAQLTERPVLSTDPPCTLSAVSLPPGTARTTSVSRDFRPERSASPGDASGRFCGSSSWWPCPAEPALRDRNRIRRNRVPARARGGSRSSAGDTGRRPPAGAVRSTG